MAKKKLEYIVYFIYLSVLLFLSYHHEIWRDEADSWLLVRDSNFTGIRSYLQNSGHPGLWYLILYPFAKLGLPSITQKLIHFVIASINSYLLLFYSPFHKYLKILILFSYYFMFEYAVISRNYAIGIFFLFVICINYNKKFKYPILYGFLIFLLCNTNAYSAILASGISLIFFLEIIHKRKFYFNVILGFLISVLGGFLFLLQVYKVPESSQVSSGFFRQFVPENILKSILYSFSTGVFTDSILYLPSIVLLPLSFLLYSRAKLILLFLIWCLGLLFSFYTFVYMYEYRHAGFVFLSFFTSYWLYNLNSKSNFNFINLNNLFKLKKLTLLTFLFSLFISLEFSFEKSMHEYLYSYSNAIEMANYIKKNNLDSNSNRFGVHSADKGKTILFYLNETKIFYYPFYDRFASHMLWNKEQFVSEGRTCLEAVQIFNKKFQGETKYNYYFISSSFLPKNTNYQLVYSTQNLISPYFMGDEQFHLYKVKM
jgi:hypothetical protein